MSCEIIAEVANSHQGEFHLAKKIVKTFSSYGATSIKFQIYFAEDFYLKIMKDLIIFKNQSF